MPDFKAINMFLAEPIMDREAANYAFFVSLPLLPPSRYSVRNVKGSQFATSLFEYHSACAGCGETPYIRLLTQLFGDRLLIGNATGCISIYGGNLPTIPYTKRADGRGPAWSNSLFEDNAEFAFGMGQTVRRFAAEARLLLQKMSQSADARKGDLITAILSDGNGKAGGADRQAIEEKRAKIEDLKKLLVNDASPKRAGSSQLSITSYARASGR